MASCDENPGSVTIMEIEPNKPFVSEGFPMNFTIYVKNNGNVKESVNLTLFANGEVIEARILAVLPGESKNTISVWRAMERGDYKIRVETDSLTYIMEGVVYVVASGDVNNDFKVDIVDVGLIAKFFRTHYPEPSYNATYDIDNNGAMGIHDIAVAARSVGRDRSISISVDSANHENYGLTYPITYIFSIPNIPHLTAYKKYNSTENWVKIPERFKGELFNGVEAARFDYEVNKAYISIAFGAQSDTIYVVIRDGDGKDLAVGFLGIADYYDNRKFAVTITIDDVGEPPPWGGNEKFLQATRLFADAQVWWTPAISTRFHEVNWTLYQQFVNMGFIEVGSHSQTHPHLPYTDPNAEIGGSRDDILSNLVLPYSKGGRGYVWSWLPPYGESDATVLERLGKYKYLVSRHSGGTGKPAGWADWDSNNSVYNGAAWTVFWDTRSLADLNRIFDSAYASGGTYHLVGHLGKVGWTQGEVGYEHVNHIRGKTDVWYAGFGQLYAYHYVQEMVVVNDNQSEFL